MGSSRQQSALLELARLYQRNGVLRLPNAKKKAENPRSYKKGYEIRFIAYSKQELRHIQRLLRQAKLPVAASFAKSGTLHAQPLYGKQLVQGFLEFLELLEIE